MPQDRTQTSSARTDSPSIREAPHASGRAWRTRTVVGRGSHPARWSLGRAGAVIAVSLALLGSGCAAPRAHHPREVSGPGDAGRVTTLDPADLDRSARPCKDFYRFANGGWMDRSSIPPDRGLWSMGMEMDRRNRELLARIVADAAAAEAPRGTTLQQVGDFYRSAVDTAAIEARGLDPLAPDLGRVARLRNPSDLVGFLAELHSRGEFIAFRSRVQPDLRSNGVHALYVLQGGLGLPENGYYLREDAATRDVLRQYEQHIATLLSLLGQDAASAAADAKRIVKLEHRLARVSQGPRERRDPEKQYRMTTVAEANSLTPRIDWEIYLDAIGVTTERFSFPHPDFFRELDSLLVEEPIESWQAYLRWHLLRSAAPYLPSAVEREHFRFSGTVLSGIPEMEPRRRRALAALNDHLGDELGQLYVTEAFPPEAKARALAMFEHLRGALRERLERLDWLGEQTRAEALAKLEAMTPKLGYPDRWRDYSSLVIEPDAYLDNVRRARVLAARTEFAKAGHPLDSSDWILPPQIVDAYYDRARNEVVFPAGIMQPPMFDPLADDAVNFGGMGTVIGHEIMHGFDDQGSRFDADGRFREWWTEADRAEFVRRADVLVRQFDAYEPLPGLHVDGRLTLGENIADLGGVIVAFEGFQRALRAGGQRETIDGFTPEQRFFLWYAQSWRRLQREESLRLQLRTDSHAPGRYRAIGPLSNLDAFADAFGCAETDPVMRPDSARVRLW